MAKRLNKAIIAKRLNIAVNGKSVKQSCYCTNLSNAVIAKRISKAGNCINDRQVPSKLDIHKRPPLKYIHKEYDNLRCRSVINFTK